MPNSIKLPIGTVVEITELMRYGNESAFVGNIALVVRHGMDTDGIYTEIKDTAGNLHKFHRSFLKALKGAKS